MPWFPSSLPGCVPRAYTSTVSATLWLLCGYCVATVPQLHVLVLCGCCSAIALATAVPGTCYLLYGFGYRVTLMAWMETGREHPCRVYGGVPAAFFFSVRRCRGGSRRSQGQVVGASQGRQVRAKGGGVPHNNTEESTPLNTPLPIINGIKIAHPVTCFLDRFSTVTLSSVHGAYHPGYVRWHTSPQQHTR